MQPLDLWTLFVQYVFGNFWFAVIGISLLIFAIFMLGRMSIFSTQWYVIMFILAMALGYGYVTINIVITISLIVALFYSWQRYMDNK